MSEIVFHKGKLTRIHYEQKGFETLEDYCKFLCYIRGIEKPPYYHTYKELMYDNLYDEYLIMDNKIFKIEDVEEDPGHFINLYKESSDSYTYQAEFYNGSNSLHGLLINELKKYE